MKKNKFLLSVLPVLILLFALTLTSLAADPYSAEENTVYVSTYAELKAELEDLNATADSNKLVVLKNNISVTNQNIDYNIYISYPGKLFLDLNGYSLNVDSNRTDALFNIRRAKSQSDYPKTTFTILNSKTKVQSTVTLHSNYYAYNGEYISAAILKCNNSQANINIFGYAQINSSGNFTTPNLAFKMNVNKNNTYTGRAFNIINVTDANDFYINGALFEFGPVKGTPVFIFKINRGSLTTITGQSQFYRSSKDECNSNAVEIVHHSSYSKQNILRLGNLNIENKNHAGTPLYIDGATTGPCGSNGYWSDIVPAAANPSLNVNILHGLTVTNFRTVPAKSFASTDKRTRIISNCCSVSGSFTEHYIFGSVKKCNTCHGIKEIKAHNYTSLIDSGKMATCTEGGISPKYKCSDSGCKFYTGGTALNPLGHSMTKGGTLCNRCKKLFNPAKLKVGANVYDPIVMNTFTPEKDGIYTFFTTPLQGYKFYRYDISPIVDGKYCPEQSFDLGTKVDPLDIELKGGVSYVVYSICYGGPISSYVLTITEKDVSHNPEKPDNPGGDSQGNPSANCSCGCHKKGIVKFFFKIGLFFQKIFKKNRVCKCGVWHY